jgi:uncharacterized protein
MLLPRRSGFRVVATKIQDIDFRRKYSKIRSPVGNAFAHSSLSSGQELPGSDCAFPSPVSGIGQKTILPPESPFMRRYLACCLLAVIAAATSIGSSRADLLQFDKADLTIATASGPKIFHVEIAATEAQREQGLMYRPMMAADAGMVFLYDHPQQVAFWMKNTIIPLDMVFIGGNGRIVSIHERAVPFSEATIPSGPDAQDVLEVNGGTVARLGIAVGDLVTGPALAPR